MEAVDISRILKANASLGNMLTPSQKGQNNTVVWTCVLSFFDTDKDGSNSTHDW